MATVVKNNLSANNTLNKLNVNNSELAKSLKKVSSGMRINGAGDGASEYSIGAKMEVMMRSLGQDIENTQTGRNLVKTAEGGIQEIINNIRDMKEMALNSANAHNSDVDREILQKDFSARMRTIADIAATTNYDGRLLLNGDYSEWRNQTFSSSTVSPSGSTTPTTPASSGTSTTQNTTVSNLVDGFKPSYAAKVSNVMVSDNGNGVPVTNSFAMDKNGWNWPKEMNLSTSGSSQLNQYAVEVDFSAMVLAAGATLPSALHGQGFAILCGTCPQYINIKFDATKTATETTYNQSPSNSNRYAREFVIGVKDVTNADELAKAIFDGIASTPNVGTYRDPKGTDSNGNKKNLDLDTADNILIDNWAHQVRMAKDLKTGKYLFLKDNSHLQFLNETMESDNPTPIPDPDPNPNPNPNPNPWTEIVQGNPLIIHTGPKASQHLRVYINSMHPIAMGLNGAAVDPLEKAIKAIDIVDKALDYALNESVRMGAYQVRLNETEDNLVAAEENTTSSMSTMRDADMAKEMMTYTKNNVLSQTAQSMLSQANQNIGSTIDLLQ